MLEKEIIFIKDLGMKFPTTKSNHKTRYGLTSHRLYHSWFMMVDRCNNPKNQAYIYYGLKGIKVCNRWLDFVNFIEDVYSTFKEGLTLDRIDVNGNYEPSNCRWASREIQNRNTVKIRKNNKTGYRGVSWHKKSNKFRSQITVSKKVIFIGCFIDKVEAAKAYDKYVIDNNLEHTKNFS